MPINGNIPFDVNGGDPIKHQDFNDILRQLRLLSSTAGVQNAIINGAGVFSTPLPTDDLRNTAFVWVRNDTGADIDVAYPILELNAIVNAPDDEDTENIVPYVMPAFLGTTPNEVTTKFAILQGKVGDAEWRIGLLSGISWVKLIVNDETHTTADVQAGSNVHLETTDSGFAEILWKETSGSPRWAVVRIGSGGSGSSSSSQEGGCGCGDFVEVGTVHITDVGDFAQSYETDSFNDLFDVDGIQVTWDSGSDWIGGSFTYDCP